MVVLFIALSPHFTAEMTATPLSKQTIIWNVGQGQWTTFVDFQKCVHIDMGGEFNPIKSVKKLCHYKFNVIAISHWDLDHYSFVSSYIKSFSKISESQFCKTTLPKYKKPKQMPAIYRLPDCNSLPNEVQLIYNPNRFDFFKNKNESSVVFAINHLLLPADSPSQVEKIWSATNKMSKIKILNLGHHGSKTSTSHSLIRNLPNLKMAVSSARYRKYKHPHIDVVKKLKTKKVPLLRTEEWGHIHFEF